LEIGKVREVLDLTTVTKVPQTCDFMRGVINLRGNVVPVVDMRRRFDMAPAEATVNSCIIIVEVSFGSETAILGAIADAVEEVLELEPGLIEPPPKIGAKMDTGFIRGMGRRDERFIIILNIDNIFSNNDLLPATGGDANEDAA